MFGLMKILRREQYNTDERLGLSDLSVGSTVGFGFMPQKNLSGCRLTVKTVNTYFFGEDGFPAYVLDDGGDEINLIVTKDEGDSSAYLSLSQSIKETLFPLLFVSAKPESWFALNVGDIVETSNRVMGMRQSWVAPRYKLVMRSRGSMVEGASPPYNFATARQFDYVMLADEAGEHALEAEKYEDGTLVVYATVYRPATDIGEISSPVPALRKTPPAVSAVVKQQVRENVEKEQDTKETDTKTSTKGQSTVITMVPKSSAVVKEDKKNETNDQLTVDAKLAVGIINEAQRNQMSIAALIRKVIDLPEAINDQVNIQFALSVAEYNELTERYHLEYSDHAGVKENIVKELRQFIGVKK